MADQIIHDLAGWLMMPMAMGLAMARSPGPVASLRGPSAGRHGLESARIDESRTGGTRSAAIRPR